jgi:hypothetical protein
LNGKQQEVGVCWLPLGSLARVKRQYFISEFSIQLSLRRPRAINWMGGRASESAMDGWRSTGNRLCGVQGPQRDALLVCSAACWQNAHVDSRNGKEINGGGSRVKIDCEMAFDRGINTRGICPFSHYEIIPSPGGKIADKILDKYLCYFLIKKTDTKYIQFLWPLMII